MQQLSHRQRRHQRSSQQMKPRTSEVIFSLENVTVNFNGIMALKDVSLKIAKGEMLFITGASGAGKTTLLKLLTRDLNPTSGEMQWVSSDKLFVAPVYQDLKLMENLTVEENLWFAYDKKIYKTKKYFASEVKELIHLLGMGDRMHLKVSVANGGLRHKTAFLRALLTRPDVIVCDELTAALDADNAKKMYDILNLLNVKRGLTVIWATHNRDLITKFSGKIIHLDKGRLVHTGQSCFI